jgi:N-acetylmuramoyl-L-alanine amidase
MAQLNTKTINDLLAGKQNSTSFFDNVKTKQLEGYELYELDNTTKLGAEILKNDQGYITVTIVDDQSLDKTTGVLVQIGNQTAIYPEQPDGIYDIDVSNGVFTIIDSDLTIEEFVQDSAGGEPTLDSAGNPITISTVVGTVPVVKSTGTDTPQKLPELTESLTGIVPPLEPLAIIALGGAAVSEITNTIKVASERKKSLMTSINEVASSASLDGLGSSITEGINDVKQKLDNVISKDLTKDITDAVSNVENIANDTINELSNAIDDAFAGVIDEITSATDDLINHLTPNTSTGGGFIQDLFEDLTGDVGATLQSLLGSSVDLSSEVISSVIKDVLQGGDVDLTKAAKSIALLDTSVSKEMTQVIRDVEANDPISYKNAVIAKAKARGVANEDIVAFENLYAEIETALSKVDTTISGKIVSEVGEFYTEDTDLKELIKRYVGADTKKFEYVSSKEELGLEFYRMTRPVSEMVIHATETYTNANIGSEEIHLRHKEAGHTKGIQYHYVIRRDGRLQRGMPLDQVSDASNVRGHAQNCVDIVLVGGVNVPSEADNPLENLSSQSFTQVQMKTLEALMETFYHHAPGGQIFGHNELDENVEDPYFDVISFVENKFGKKSVYADLLTEQSLSPKDLVNKRPI